MRSTGTQDNGTLAYSGHAAPGSSRSPGDGGDSGFDAVDPNIHFHTYTGGQMDVNYHGNDPTTWLWIGDAFIVNFPESLRFYAPAISPTRSSRRRSSSAAQHVWRTQNLGGDRAFLEAHCNTAAGEFGTSDLLYTGACGTPTTGSPLGGPSLTRLRRSARRRAAATSSSLAACQDDETMWARHRRGRVLDLAERQRGRRRA